MSTRQAFLNRLRAGLRGLPPAAINDIMSDYDTHFAEAAAKGRSEEEVAKKLGDPTRLVRELRAEAGLRRWEEQRTAASAVGAIVAVLGLATIDVFILLPLLIAVGAALLALIISGACVCLAGALFLVVAMVHLVPGFGGSWLQGVLLGIGITSGGASTVAFCILFLVGMVNLLVRYGRLHYRALQPMVASTNEEYAA